MNQDRDQQQPQSGIGRSNDSQQEDKHPSPFKETSTANDNTENNTEEESKVEQECKEAMTERD